MKKFLVAMGLVAFAVVGCGDDESWSPSARANDDSSEVTSSSSEKAKSSLSDTQSEEKQSSSSEKTGKSSSSTDDASSSSEKLGSSSSVETPKSSISSSADEMESSSSSKIGCKTETEDDCEYGELTDNRDGQTYKTVKIGDQWWMAENLNFDPGQGGSGEDKYDWSWCYKDNADNCVKYGRLYTWAAAMDGAGTWSTHGKGCGNGKTCSPTYPVRGVCPQGWHLPTKTEWNTLFTAVGGESVAGKKLKSTSRWNNSGNGADAFSFSALPAGYRDINGDYFYEGRYAYFWSSTDFSSSGAYGMDLHYINDRAGLYLNDKDDGFSVRCLKD